MARPPDTVWNHVVIWGDVTNRWSARQSYGMAERRCSKALRARRSFYPRFSMRIWIHEHQDGYFSFHRRAKWGVGLTGSQIVRRRRIRQKLDARKPALIKSRYHGYRPVEVAKVRNRYR